MTGSLAGHNRGLGQGLGQGMTGMDGACGQGLSQGWTACDRVCGRARQSLEQGRTGLQHGLWHGESGSGVGLRTGKR